MLYEQKTLKIFMQNYHEALRTSVRLKLSFKRLKSSFPLNKEQLINPSDELLDGLDAFRVRYTDLQDCIGNKLFRGILLLEEEQALNMLDTINKMAKRGIIDDVNSWRAARIIRNDFTHDYPDHDTEKTEALNAAWQTAPMFIDILINIKAYFKPNLNLESV